MLLKSLEEKLKKSNFRVVTAADGEEALARARESTPELILLDIVLPKKSGMEVLEELKKDEKLKHIPVIILTNLDDEETISKAVALGARGYLLKADIDLQEVVDKTIEILG